MHFAQGVLDVPAGPPVGEPFAPVQIGAQMEHLQTGANQFQNPIGARRAERHADRDNQPRVDGSDLARQLRRIGPIVYLSQARGLQNAWQGSISSWLATRGTTNGRCSTGSPMASRAGITASV